MRYEVINLKSKFASLANDVNLSVYSLDNSPEISPNRKRPAVIICPGGGYAFTSDREAEPIAMKFLSCGYQAFVLRYSVAPHRYPTQLLELAAALAYVRSMAEEYHVIRDQISTIGFSAGGHLVASLGTLWNEPFISEALGVSSEHVKPNALILSYPVITSGEFAHVGSFDNLVGEDAALREYLSLENRVSKNTPPSFIWHTFTDDGVPVENSLLFANAMRKSSIPFEMHIFPNGPHGLGLATEETKSVSCDRTNDHAAVWFDLCDAWLKTMFGMCD